MFQAIFYKEWVKSRNVVILLGVIAIALVAHSLLMTTHLFRNDGAVSAWISVSQGEVPAISTVVKSFFLVSAIALSVIQYTSEMVNKRFKLTLHLPKSENFLFTALLLYGVLVLSVIYTAMTAMLMGVMAYYYPQEILIHTLLDLIPQMLIGFAAYFFIAWVVIEPIWKRRLAALLVSLATLEAFVVTGRGIGTLLYSIPYLFLIVIIAVACAFYSASRFKDGAQD